MVFIEHKLDNWNYTYTVTDIFGTIKILTPVKLEKKMLDLLVEKALQSGVKELLINETIKIYFQRDNSWQKDEE